MSENKNTELPFKSEDQGEQALWAALKELPRDMPSEDMRRGFYRELGRAGLTNWSERIRGWFGFDNNAGWLTAAICILIGLGVGQSLTNQGAAESSRIAALEQQLVSINRELILDRLQDPAAGNRLRGVIDAQNVAQNDTVIARALLARATGDRVYSVRSAAIEALGPSLNSVTVGNELMSLLEEAESPLVQLALVDMVLRYGSDSQLQHLLTLANAGRLHPDLNRHVLKSLGGESV